MKKFNLIKYRIFIIAFLFMSAPASAEYAKSYNSHYLHSYSKTMNIIPPSMLSKFKKEQFLLANIYYEEIGLQKNYDFAFEPASAIFNKITTDSSKLD